MKNYKEIRKELFEKLNKLGDLNIEARESLKKIIDWLAWQLATLHVNLRNSQSRVKSSIIRQLFPEIASRALPAHSIAFAQPNEPNYQLDGKEDFTIENGLPDEDIFFTPVFENSLIRGKIALKLTQGGLLRKGNSHNSWEKINTSKVANLNENEVYLGISLGESITQLESLSFFFDWEDIDQKNYSKIQLIQWEFAGKQLSSKAGFNWSNDLNGSIFPDAEFFKIKQLKEQIYQYYKNQFITIDLQGISFAETKLPFSLNNFSLTPYEESINIEKLIWVKLTFPEGLTKGFLENLQININCFPVWNVKVIIDQDERATSPMIIPLTHNMEHTDNKNYFLGLQRVWSDTENFRPVAYGSYATAEPGSYALYRGNIGPFNAWDMSFQITGLLYAIKEYQQIFGKIEQEQLYANLESLEKEIQGLQQVIEANDLENIHPNYYLHIKPTYPKDMIYIEFLLTQGNQVLMKDFLEEQPLSTEIFEDVYLLKKPTGGRAPLTQPEQQEAIRELIINTNFSYKQPVKKEVVVEEIIL